MKRKSNEDFILKAIKYFRIISISIIFIISFSFVFYNYTDSLKKESIEKNYSGFNDEIKKIIEIEQKLEKQFDRHIYNILLISISFSILFLVLTILISELLKNRFLNYIECFEEQVKENEKQILKNKIQRETLLRMQKVSHFGDWKLDLQSKNFFCSNEVIQILGLNKHEKYLKLELFKNIIFKEDIKKLKKSLYECVKKDKEHRIIYRIKNLDNDIKWIESRGILYHLKYKTYS